ncbi:MAG: carboxy terminal-processing peptidase [Deinococcales bacterium]|nr:carboxy terminal-processing peptidase [Chitinophagaceae bacterium]
MIQKKGWLLLIVVVFAGIFFAFRSITPNPIPTTQKQKLLAAIGMLLQEQHYSPKPLNDAFSKEIFKKYLDELDGDKSLFLKTDIDALKKYELTIDDEIKATQDLQFLPAINAIYDKRIVEIISIYKNILSKPFDFRVDETLITNSEKINYANNEAERKDRWRKRLKYLTLERYTNLLDDRSKSKVDSVIKKTDIQLEVVARNSVLKALDRTYNRIKVRFNEDERFNAFINVITNLMDPHSDYFAPVEKRAFDEQMSGRFYGIGAQLQEQQDGTIKIMSLVPGGPAFKSGDIIVNDVIVKVGQGGNDEMVDVTGFDVTDAVKLIRGNKSTEVKLTLKKSDGTYKTVSILRDEIVQDEGFARSVIVKRNDKKIGYIMLPDFYANFEDPKGARSSVDVAREVEKLKEENVDGIVIDLRNNGGGSLYEVIQMVGLFIKQGPVVQVRDRDGRNMVMDDKDQSVLYDGPLAVMVNEFSASASEIFAAAIQDYKRGIIVGSTSTYGKGTVQRSVPLGKRLDFFSDRTEFGSVKLTFQKFYRVNGGSTQLKGVESDIVLPDIYELSKYREKENKAALPWDEITKAPILTYNGFEGVINEEKEKIKLDTTFNMIKNNVELLSKTNDAPINLQIDKYKTAQKQLRATSTQINSLIKLKDSMNVSVLKVDYDKFYNNAYKTKQDVYQDWIKRIKTDLYINETVKIVSNMIASQNPVAVIKK